jgi:hypothetical protein
MEFDWKGYSAQEPLLVTASGVVPVGPVESGQAWLERLSSAGDQLRGVILPLELKTACHRRQHLFGLELLEWLRWSAAETARYVPVLAMAFHPLSQVLKRTPNVLLVVHGTDFARLPEVAETDWALAQQFVAALRSAGQGSMCARPEDIEQATLGGTRRAVGITHHDLANEYYAAKRLWAGYQRALRDAVHSISSDAIEREIQRVEQVRFPWEDKLERAKLQPTFRQFQLSRRDWEFPANPPIDDSARIMQVHSEDGLPAGTRILLVDDDFDKGMAEVLLQILFRQAEFSRRLDLDQQEWVYSEQSGSIRWARFACVKDIASASYWLKYWHPKDLDRLPAALPLEKTQDAWKRRWAAALQADAADNVEYILDSLDDPTARPKNTQTIVLLDLRLTREELPSVYATRQLQSVRLREAIKAADTDFPIIMLTASRQAVNFAAVMGGAREVDGWLNKEAPDVPADDENSARAVHYLLERLHLFACLRDWYRPEFEWNLERKLAYARLYNSPYRDSCLQHVAGRATQTVQALLQGSRTLHEKYKGEKFYSCIESEVTPNRFEIERRLVARRVAIAALLHTAQWLSDGPRWDVDAFRKLMPGRPDNAIVKAVYNVVNFNDRLWLTTSDTALIDRLLIEEYDWLDTFNWQQHGEAIRQWVSKAKQGARG